MACAFKCDRCGKYYDDSTSSIGPTIYKSKNTRILDLCKECKASLTDWLASPMDKSKETAVVCDRNDWGYPKHVEGFIKSCSFDVTHYQSAVKYITVKYITVKRFIEALEEYFDYKWNEDEFHSPAETPSKTVEEFVHNGMHFEDLDRPVSSDRDRVITLEWAKEALKRYFNYEWSDEIYDKY